MFGHNQQGMSKLSPNLSAALAKVRNDSFLKQAKMVRDWQEGPERAEQAKLLIRQALVEWATGSISQEIESKLYNILHFAMPGNRSDESDEYATEYHQQLARQECADCGDGACPTEPKTPRQSPPSES